MFLLLALDARAADPPCVSLHAGRIELGDSPAAKAYVLAIRKQANPVWVHAVDALSDQLPRDRARYVTRIELALAADGEVRGVCMTMSSGLPALDAAAVDALRSAGPYAPLGSLSPGGADVVLAGLDYTVQPGEVRETPAPAAPDTPPR
jgi:hypothetical protein